MNMALFWKTRKRELTFAAAAVLLLLALAGFAGEGLGFLARELNSVFGGDAALGAPLVQFDIEGAKKLGL